MPSKPNRITVQQNNNPMRQRDLMNVLNGVGSLSNLNNEVRQLGPPFSASYLHDDMFSGNPLHSSVPPLPPRNEIGSMNRYRYSGYPGMNRYSNLNSFYGSYSPSRYSSLYSGGLYSPMSSYRMPYGHYGAPNDSYNSFVQMAEESTRPAFESIESVVHVVNSISMMLESTYGAVHSSYSAILGVVDQFSRLKDHLAQIFSVLALLRGLHWLCLKVLYLLGLRKTNPSVEEAWQNARKAAASGVYPLNTHGSAWPFFMFLSLVVGAPWLMFKLLSKNIAKKQIDPNMWHNSKNQKYTAYAAYDFVATQPGELSFRAGDKLILLPRDVEGGQYRQRRWIMACNEQKESGLIPSNYLKSVSNKQSNTRNEVVIPEASALQNYAQSNGVAVAEQHVRNFDAITAKVPKTFREQNPTLNIVQQPLSLIEDSKLSVQATTIENSNGIAPSDKNIAPVPSDILKENTISSINPAVDDVLDSVKDSNDQHI